MAASFHEDFGRGEEVEGSSDRAFGLTVGGILLAIALMRIGLHWWAGDLDAGIGWFERILAGLGCVLLVLGLVAPGTLYWPNRGWTMLGLLLFKVVNPVVLGLIYLLAIVPIGLIIRITGGDPLKRKFDPDAKSYWIVRDPPGPEPATMKQQF